MRMYAYLNILFSYYADRFIKVSEKVSETNWETVLERPIDAMSTEDEESDSNVLYRYSPTWHSES